MDELTHTDDLPVANGDGNGIAHAECRAWRHTGRFCPPAWCGHCDNVRAFNEGCDARLAGLSRHANPYERSSPQGRRWLTGWEHVDHNWGCDARRHTGAVRPLPDVGS